MDPRSNICATTCWTRATSSIKPSARLRSNAINLEDLWEARSRAAGFKDGENTDQAVLDSIARGQLSRRLVFVDVGCKVSKRPSMFFSHCDGVILHAFGVLEQERFQIAEIHIQAIKKLRK